MVAATGPRGPQPKPPWLARLTMVVTVIVVGVACAGPESPATGSNPGQPAGGTRVNGAAPQVTGSVLGQGSAAENLAITTEGRSDVVIQRVTIPPGGRTGWHTHPGTVLVVVKAGRLTRYTADCAAVAYPAGQAFVETQGVHEGRNEGTDPVDLYVTYIDPAGSPLKTDAAAPACAR